MKNNENASVRPDFVPKEAYIDSKFVALEKDRLWSNTWQVACREEELPEVGNYVAFNVADESIVVLRNRDGFKAFHNVCQHRGRRLVDGFGKINQFRCPYHGWRWKLDGSLAEIVDEEDWAGCPEMNKEDLGLPEVKLASWGGFLFINLDPEAEPLAQFLDPMPDFLDAFEFEKMRYRWYKSVRLPCNWKVALEAFSEGYHVATTHPQLLDNGGDDRTLSFAQGKHGMFLYPYLAAPPGAPSPRTGKPIPKDLRPGVIKFYGQLENELKAIFSPRDAEAVGRLLTEVPADAEAMEVLGQSLNFQRQAAESSGAGWPNLSPEKMAEAGTDWHVFPNLVMLMFADGLLAYRARPDGDNPDSCIYDIWSLVRYAPGTEPDYRREFYHGSEDWKTDTEQRFGKILAQDFMNMEHVQQGMKSSGFKGSRTNPKQESSVSNFHRVLWEYYQSE